MPDHSTYRSQVLDHLGLVAGMFDELGFGDVIARATQQHPEKRDRQDYPVTSRGQALSEIARRLEVGRRLVRQWIPRFLTHRIAGVADQPGRGRRPVFPPGGGGPSGQARVRWPDRLGRSLSQGDCLALARQLQREGLVESISAETVRRILEHHKLKPWRHHAWLSPTPPRDAEFSARVSDIVTLCTRRLRKYTMVLCVDTKPSLQPRPRLHAISPALPGRPHQVEHAYKRDGAPNLCAAFDTRTGRGSGQCYERKRQGEFIAFLAHLDAAIPARIKTLHLVCDNVRPHHGKPVRAWVHAHPRFVWHFTPVHCSWLNQVEPWFSILQHKRLRTVDFATKADLRAKLLPFIAEWNERGHPFNWTTKSVAKVMAEALPAAA